LAKKGRGRGHVTYFSYFVTPQYLWNGLRYKLQILQADRSQLILNQKKKNRLERGRGLGHVTYFKFWDSLISLERLKIQSSNVARGMKVRDTKSKNEKF